MISIQSGWEDILAIIKVFFAFILSFLGIIFIIYHENAIAPRFSFYADFWKNDLVFVTSIAAVAALFFLTKVLF